MFLLIPLNNLSGMASRAIEFGTRVKSDLGAVNLFKLVGLDTLGWLGMIGWVFCSAIS